MNLLNNIRYKLIASKIIDRNDKKLNKKNRSLSYIGNVVVMLSEFIDSN